MHQLPWEAQAAAKRAATLAKINPRWRLAPEDLERARHQRDLTGLFIQEFLDADTVSITSMNSLPILAAIRDQKLSATEVVTAFCKTAAVAHQIVSSALQLCLVISGTNLMLMSLRTTVFTRSSLRKHSIERSI